MVLLVTTLLMVFNLKNRGGTSLSCRLILFLLVLTPGSGCRQGVYRVSNLPTDCLAPLPNNPETLNLAGLADASVSREIIQIGDVLELTMLADYAKLTTTTTPVRVADDGTIVVPLVGKVSVAGLEAKQAEQAIAAESISRGLFRNPCFTLTMKQCRTNKITVVGAVNKPGPVELPRASSSLLSALVAADGLSKDADEEVEIRRTDARAVANQPQGDALYAPDAAGNQVLLASRQQQQQPAAPAVLRINLNSAALGAEKLPELCDGDVVYVAKRMPKPVYVIGLVRKPGEFPYPVNQELRVLDAIALAGGCSNPLAENVLVIRRPPGKLEPIRIAVSLQAAKQGQDNLALAPGDTVSVEQTPVTAVADMIQTFVRIGLGASMSLY
jgi:polysaccharide export outer membrane protein